MNMFCIKCGKELEPGAQFCSKCGHSTNVLQDSEAVDDDYTPKNSTATALLAMFTGMLGIHDFYAGKMQIGIAKVVLAFFGIFAFRPILLVSLIWQFIDVIRIATGSYKDGNGHPVESALWTVVYTTIGIIVLFMIPIIIIRIVVAQ